MKKILNLIMAFSILIAAPVAMAEGPLDKGNFSANFAMTTDYMYRGITQSNEQPAISGGFDWAYETGSFANVYAGIWASSLEFGDGDTSTEIDYYIGLNGEFANGITWDTGWLYYQYPATDADSGPGVGDFDFWEIHGKLGYTFADVALEPSIGFGIDYSPDFFGEDDDGIYYSGTLGLSLPMEFGLSFTVGHQDVDGDKTTGLAAGVLTDQGFDYTHYVVGLSRSVSIFDLDVSWYDTFDNGSNGGADFCNDEACSALVFTIGAAF